MHYSTFSEFREILLRKSQSIVEDETGIPYKSFDPLQWEIHLFGVCVMPVKYFIKTS